MSNNLWTERDRQNLSEDHLYKSWVTKSISSIISRLSCPLKAETTFGKILEKLQKPSKTEKQDLKDRDSMDFPTIEQNLWKRA